MKHTLALCLSVAAAASAQAQDKPVDKLTIYGIMDSSVVRLQSGDKGSMWQLRDGGINSSRLGFSGMEQLGGGYRAGFVIETQVSLDTGSGSTTNTTNQPSGNTTGSGATWHRKATVSLYTPFGEVRFGRDYTTTFVPATYMDPFNSGGVASASSLHAFYTPTLALPTLVRASNTVQYYIPSTLLPGFYAYAQAAPSEGTGGRYVGVGTGYRKSGLLVSAAVAQTKNPLGGSAGLSPETVSADNTLDVWSIGLSYKFANGLRPMGFYHSQTLAAYGTTSPTTERDRKVDDFLLGATWDIGVHTLKFSYMQRDDKGRTDNDPTLIGLGYAYDFSKRTTAYVNFSNFKNSAGGTYNFSSSGFSPLPGQTARALQIGLSHNF
jgi:predicted porin